LIVDAHGQLARSAIDERDLGIWLGFQQRRYTSGMSSRALSARALTDDYLFHFDLAPVDLSSVLFLFQAPSN
jgi:hypothetical protein